MNEYLHDLPNVLLAGLSAVTASLVWAVNKLWTKFEECEKDRAQLHRDILDLVKHTAKNSLPDDDDPVA